MAKKRYITPEEAATTRGVTPATIRKWLREGYIEGIKMGRLWRVIEDGDVEIEKMDKKTETLLVGSLEKLQESMDQITELIGSGGNVQLIRALCTVLPQLEDASDKIRALSEMASQDER
ncbi:helix-turn-helix domain-containing protein [Dethiosulfovibrio sp. F2B]|uniref:helix-turn-helix domain-containing protein n=1 Tax=Dethiosulfovibrio faecalis TaxID=2720018 RepID=UPI001F33E1CB|nr:helix-turn-helix domain-containing protein [Dethiosulfovibrio faecalis]MCF4151691.1 helix-turn-helix domain-containing protein [Dethiosulfovibrio faecalis]